MYKKITILLLFAFITLQCSKDFSSEPSSMNISLTAQEKSILASAEDFGFELFDILQQSTPDSNIFISPLSISMALGMTLNGADTETETAMRETLGFSGLTQDEINRSYQHIIELLTSLDPKTVMEIANSIWYRQEATVLQEFITVNKKYFDADVRPINFNDPHTVDTINNWCADKTHDKIKQIINRIDPDDYMFLINAIYFKGMWQYEFDPDATIADYHFRIADDESTPVNIMVQTHDEFQYTQTDDAQFIDLPYGNGQFAMSIILPEHDVDFNTWSAQFTEQKWRDMLAGIEQKRGTLYLPKFKIEYSKKLNDPLIHMGMGIAFTDQADFSKMNGRHDLYIGFVRHKTFVELDEKGTKAAAATVVGMKFESVSDDPPVDFNMVVNRPFLYILHEKATGSVLFMGKMLNPNEGA